jgi:hypothetical protein
MTEYVTKDSGKRLHYGSGMVRDTQEGKPDYTLIEPKMLRRWAELMTRGAEKYGRRNWEQADSPEEYDRFLASGLRHHYQYLAGETDEDHAAAVMFNLAAAEYVKAKLDASSDAERVATDTLIFHGNSFCNGD